LPKLLLAARQGLEEVVNPPAFLVKKVGHMEHVTALGGRHDVRTEVSDDEVEGGEFFEKKLPIFACMPGPALDVENGKRARLHQDFDGEVMEEDVIDGDDTKALTDLGASVVEEATRDSTEVLAALREPGRAASVAIEGQRQDLGGGIDGNLSLGQDEVELVELALGDLGATSELFLREGELATQGGVVGPESSVLVESELEVTMTSWGPRRLRAEGSEGLVEELIGAGPAKTSLSGEVLDALVGAKDQRSDEMKGGMGLGEGGGRSVERHLGTPPVPEILADGRRRGRALTPGGRLPRPAISSRPQATLRTDPDTPTDVF
jgi:hypothetical protein